MDLGSGDAESGDMVAIVVGRRSSEAAIEILDNGQQDLFTKESRIICRAVGQSLTDFMCNTI